MNSLLLSKPLFIKDKSVVGILLPNTKESNKALKQFAAGLELKEKKEFDKWVKELESSKAHSKYDSIVADADTNNGWVDGKDFFNKLKQSRSKA